MSDEYDAVVADLLGDGPTEIVTNPNEGVYDNVPFLGATLKRNNSGSFAAELQFQLENDNPIAIHRERLNLPEADSHPVSKNVALRWYHAIGIVPRGNKATPLVGGESDEAREHRAQQIVSALDSRKGTRVSFSLKEDDSGFLRASPRLLKS
jgi:hypothetical protein